MVSMSPHLVAPILGWWLRKWQPNHPQPNDESRGIRHRQLYTMDEDPLKFLGVSLVCISVQVWVNFYILAPEYLWPFAIFFMEIVRIWLRDGILKKDSQKWVLSNRQKLAFFSNLGKIFYIYAGIYKFVPLARLQLPLKKWPHLACP